MNANDAVKRHFNTVAPTYKSNYQGNNIIFHSFDTRLKIVLDFIGDPSHKSILDIGCGPGVLAKYLVNYECEFVGLDISHRMIDECKQDQDLKSFKFVAEDPLEYFEINPNEKFEIITCMGLFEYLTDKYRSKLMQKITEHLSDAGIFIATYPNYWSLYRLTMRLYRALSGSDTMISPYTPGVGHKEFVENMLKCEWQEYNIVLQQAAYYNFRLIPKPVDQWVKSFDLWLARRLQSLSRSPLRYLGTAMVLKGDKYG